MPLYTSMALWSNDDVLGRVITVGTTDSAALAFSGQCEDLIVIVSSRTSCPAVIVGATINTSLARSTLILAGPFIHFLIKFQIKRKNDLNLTKKEEGGIEDFSFLLPFQVVQCAYKRLPLRSRRSRYAQRSYYQGRRLRNHPDVAFLDKPNI